MPRLVSAPLAPLPRAAVARTTSPPPGGSRSAVEGPFVDDGATATAAAVVPSNRRITQKVLLLGATGTEPAYQAAQSALDRLGVPYRALIGATESLSAAQLWDGVSQCNYNAVIVSTSSLGFWNTATSTWESALDATEWQALTDFEIACSARELVWYGWPSADYGLALTSTFDSDASVNATLTTAGKALFRRVKDAAVIPVRESYGYKATVIDPATTTSLVEATGGGVLVATHVGADGRQSMIATVDGSPYLAHSLVLEYDFISWVTRGLFVGKKRAYLSAQIDDLFIDNDMWSTSLHANDTNTQFRITGTDLTAFMSWQSARKASLPAGSTFQTTLAFNGVGTQTSEYSDTTLLNVARHAGTQLRWLNHTWDHENLDALSRTATRSEVQQNCSRAQTYQLSGFTCAELVTPDMSGLLNLNAVRGMLDAGVRYVVSDTSITEALRPENPGSNPSFNVGRANPLDARLYQIPRHPTSIFYDVSNSQTETDEYNAIYRSYYGVDLTYAQVLDKDSEFGLHYLLQGDIDPLMFHQANLRRFTTGGVSHTLYGDWVDAVIAKYLKYFDAPVLTLTQTQIGTAMQARAALNACGVTATVVEGTGTRGLELRSTGTCTVPVTGVAASTAGTVETYAGESTTSINLTPGVVKTVALAAQ